MRYYKFNYAKNEILTCRILEKNEEMPLADNYYYYMENEGHLIFVIVKAETMSDAKAIAKNVAEEVRIKHKRTDEN